MSESIKLTPDSYREFLKRVSDPPEPNDNLKELKVKYEDALREIADVIFGVPPHKTHLGRIFHIKRIVEKALENESTASSKEPCIMKEPLGMERLGGTDGESDPRRRE